MPQNKTIILGCGALLIIGILIGLLMFSGGSGPKQSGNKKVTVWTPVDDPETFDPLVQEWKADHKDVELKFVKKDAATYEDDLVNAIAGGGGPDVFVLKNDWIPKHLSKLAAMPIPKKAKTDPVDDYQKAYLPLIAQENVIDGKIYGKPLAVDPLVLYVNNTILDNVRMAYYNGQLPRVNFNIETLLARGPSTWDEFMALARFSRNFKGKTIKTAGAAMGTTNNIASSADILYLMMLQNGAKMTDQNKKNATFQLPSTTLTGGTTYPGTAALAFYCSFAVPKSNNYTWNRNMPRAVDRFADGKLAMMIDYSSAANYINQKSNGTLSYQELPLPQVKGTTNRVNFAKYWTFAVNRNSQDQEDAWGLINYLSSSNVEQLYLTHSGGYEPFKSTNTVNTGAPPSISGELKSSQGIYKPDAEAYDNIMKEAVNRVLGGQSPQAAIDAAAAKVTLLLNKNEDSE